MTTDTLPYIPSNMDDEECFRLHGTLPPDRIASLLDSEMVMVQACAEVNEHLQEAHDGLPCEDSAEDIIGRLEALYADEAIVDDETARELLKIIEAAKELQRDLYARAEAATKHLRAIGDSLSAWIAS